MKLLWRRAAAVAVATVVTVAGSMTAAQAVGKAKPKVGKRVGVIKIRVTDSADTNICASIWVDTVTIKGPGKSKKVRSMTLYRASTNVDNALATSGKDAICLVEYRAKNFSAGPYRATFTLKCAEAAAAWCDASAWTVDGVKALTAAGSGVAAATSTTTNPASIQFARAIKIKTGKRGALLPASTFTVSQLPPA